MTRDCRIGLAILAVVCAASLAAVPAFAQEDDLQREPGPSAPAPTPALGSPSWKALGIPDGALSAQDRRILATLSEGALQALLAGVDPAQIPTMNGQSLAQELAPLVLGSIGSELVFTPVIPCRLIDTRSPPLPAPLPFAAGETRNYDLIGPNDYSSIGGNAAGCGIPADFVYFVVVGFARTNKVRALALNIVAVGPDGPGDFRAWPTGASIPNASVINYANVAGLNIANGIILATCFTYCGLTGSPNCEPCPSGDLSFLADVAGSDLVVDVVGFFTPASTADLRGASSEGAGATIEFSDNLCHTAAATSLSAPSTGQAVVCTASLNLVTDHTNGADTRLNFTIATDATTCNTSGNPPPGVGIWKISSATPTATSLKLTLGTQRRFTAGNSFFVNVQRSQGGGAAFVDGASIICVLDQ